MGNLNTIFTKKIRERDTPVVFHKEHWSKILAAACAMKTEYGRKNNIKFINTKQWAGKRLNIFEFYIHKCFCIIFIMVLLSLWFSFFMMIILFLWFSLSWKFYASYDYHINIQHFVPLWNKKNPYRRSIQERRLLCLSMGSQIFFNNVPSAVWTRSHKLTWSILVPCRPWYVSTGFCC